MANRRRRRTNVMAVAMLGMLVLIFVLIIIIGFLLIRRNFVNPLTQADVQTADYIDAAGTPSGQRGYIEIPKNRLLQVNGKQFGKFVEKVVQKENYPLFTIACDDGTGIVFTSGTAYIASYGYLDSNGSITESFGNIVQNEDQYHYQAR